MTLTGVPFYIQETLHPRILICFSYLCEPGRYSQNLFNLCSFVIFAAVWMIQFLESFNSPWSSGSASVKCSFEPRLWPRRTCRQMPARSEPLNAQKLDARLLNLKAFMSSLGSPECSTWFSMSTLTRARNLGLKLGIDREDCVSPSEQGWGRGRRRDEPWFSQAIWHCKGRPMNIMGLGALLQESPLLATEGQILLMVTHLLEFGSVLLWVEHRFSLFNIASLYFLSAGCIPQWWVP